MINKPFISEIAKQTYAINEFGLSTMYLCVGSQRALLIDTGCGLCNLKELVGRLTDKPYDVALTHGHFDHCGGIGGFERVYANQRDFAMIKSYSVATTRAYCDQIGQMGAYQSYNFSGSMVKGIDSFPQLAQIGDGDAFDLGDRKIEVLEVAGHTPGGLVFLDEKNELLFSGDCVNSNLILSENDIDALLRELYKVKGISGKFSQNWGGHVGYAGDASCFSQPDSVLDDLIHICNMIKEGNYELKDTFVLHQKAYGVDYGNARIVLKRDEEK